MCATWLGTEASCVPHPPGAASGVGTSGVDRERSEGALIGEHDRQLAVLGMLDVEAHALVALGLGAGRAQQQLAAHARDGRRALRQAPAACGAVVAAGARGTCRGGPRSAATAR